MPRFGERSQRNLDTATENLQRLFVEVVRHYDCSVITGHRGKEEQNEAFHAGRSKLQWPDGKHNDLPARAVDVAPYPIDWKNEKRFYHFAGYVQGVAQQMGIEIRWGGDWDSDRDLTGS